MFAPRRSTRPHDGAPSADHGCPFCPDHEDETPPEIERWPAAPASWQIRVVPNKFAALEADGAPARQSDADGFVSMPGLGRHEVVIESPDHDWDLATATDGEVEHVLQAYRARHRALREAGAAAVIAFRNHREAAGTSLEHPHSQIVACPVVPDRIREQTAVATAHYDRFGTSPYVDVLERELRGGTRIVLESAGFVVFQPFAGTVAHETWLMPRAGTTSFADATDEALAELAMVLRRTLGGVAQLLDDPAYNLVVESAATRDEDLPFLSWYVRVLPRLTVPAGFELGSGVSIVPAVPEETAPALRAALPD
ncbi:MAG: galactose-1-phosphate uridylyltransferase [Dehalococcoidia bacterium]